MKPYQRSVFVFRRDLRLEDSRALEKALALSGQVICLFIVEPVFNQKPQARSFAKQFLSAALFELDENLKQSGGGLFVCFGSVQAVLQDFLQQHQADAVFINRDYTACGRQRDDSMAQIAQESSCDFYAEHDLLLFPPGFVLKADHKPYTIFTPFYRKACQFSVEAIRHYRIEKIAMPDAAESLDMHDLQAYWQVSVADYSPDQMKQACLQRLPELMDYQETRDFPAQAGTSRLSVHLKFGLISARQAWHAIAQALGPDSPMLRQLYWRDFFHHIVWHFPYVLKASFQQQFQHIPWSNNEQWFSAWCEGKTGFPIVDAGMRELNATGFMHNRLRMVTASFLVKDLHIDWRWGERYFAEKLLDYDVAVNNGSWQWAASTGCDAQPYFRIFSPWRQQQRFDKDCEYIKHWLPELSDLDSKEIHNWQTASQPYKDYPPPIVDHAQNSKSAKSLFREAASAGFAEKK